MKNVKKESYSDELKRSSVKLAIETNQPYSKTAAELGVKTSTLYTWLGKSNNLSNASNIPMQEEIRQLRSEVSKLKIERDILKKAAAYFAKNTR